MRESSRFALAAAREPIFTPPCSVREPFDTIFQQLLPNFRRIFPVVLFPMSNSVIPAGWPCAFIFAAARASHTPHAAVRQCGASIDPIHASPRRHGPGDLHAFLWASSQRAFTISSVYACPEPTSSCHPVQRHGGRVHAPDPCAA